MVTKHRTHNSDQPTNEQELVRVEVQALQEKLNRIFERANRKELNKIYQDDFDYLWDVKELALLEKKNQVEVPGTWLSELEMAIATLNEKQHSH